MGNDDKNKNSDTWHYIDARNIATCDSEASAQPTALLLPVQETPMQPGSIELPEDSESVDIYKEVLKRAPGFPWATEGPRDRKPAIFLAPYLTGLDSDIVTPEQIVEGVYINIPRSRNLWRGDLIKTVWGYNTFYTTLDANPHRDAPRLIQYMNSEQLTNYQSGVVHVHYEVVRRSRLVGISERLIITLGGKGRPRNPRRRRSVGRKGF
ncbi:hypothetical protein [Pseudomonas huanghezhanensis]|uniref:hypothetical protein n=1 Tax=Pseudomonas huanghezhanensis TaxID=3002903 RepID=UPI00228697A0|nr:hypothetical protein [Pseudomonas sp. BSw22131]